MNTLLTSNDALADKPQKASVTISLPQVAVVKGDIRENLKQHLCMVEQSAACGADLVVFPELSLTGYELELAKALAVTPDSPVCAELAQAAVRYQLVIVAGCPLKAKSGEKPAIGAIICYPDGRVSFYAKQYLHDGEGEYCSSGSSDCLISLKGHKIALAICADFASSEHPRKAYELGADLYLVSALISEKGFVADAEILSDIASTYRLPVLLSNHISETGGWSACGHNSLWQAGGERVFSSDSKEPCLILGTFSESGITGEKREPLAVV